MKRTMTQSPPGHRCKALFLMATCLFNVGVAYAGLPNPSVGWNLTALQLPSGDLIGTTVGTFGTSFSTESASINLSLGSDPSIYTQSTDSGAWLPGNYPGGSSGAITYSMEVLAPGSTAPVGVLLNVSGNATGSSTGASSEALFTMSGNASSIYTQQNGWGNSLLYRTDYNSGSGNTVTSAFPTGPVSLQLLPNQVYSIAIKSFANSDLASLSQLVPSSASAFVDPTFTIAPGFSAQLEFSPGVVAAVPEPSEALMMLTGLGVFGMIILRRKNLNGRSSWLLVRRSS